LPPGSVRIALNSTSTNPVEPPLEVTAFLTPANAATGNPAQVVVIVLNRDPFLPRTFTMSEVHRPNRYLNAQIDPASIITYIYNA
jgi:hypothetical protein